VFQQRLASEEPAELLGTLIAADSLYQRAEPGSFASSEYDAPTVILTFVFSDAASKGLGRDFFEVRGNFGYAGGDHGSASSAD
jgi:hypothetical protein